MKFSFPRIAPFLSLLLVGAAVVGCGGESSLQTAPRSASLEVSRGHSPSRVADGPQKLGLSSLGERAPRTSEKASLGALRARTQVASENDVEGANLVPPFEIVDSAGAELSSSDLVGKQAFAVVFFASWCELCARKLKMVKDTFAHADDVRLVLVSVDGPETAHHVPGFLREQRLDEEQVIDGLSHPQFTRGYNPVSSIPLVAVVSRSGTLVDYQIGLQSGDAPRLRTALLRADH